MYSGVSLRTLFEGNTIFPINLIHFHSVYESVTDRPTNRPAKKHTLLKNVDDASKNVGRIRLSIQAELLEQESALASTTVTITTATTATATTEV